MKKYFEEVASIIDRNDFSQLNEIKITKPEYFNWATEIFEGIHVARHPDKTALLWTDGLKTVEYTFLHLAEQSNQLLNFLRKKGIVQHDIILTQLMLQPINWYGTLAAIKGGFRLIPTATIMGPNDLAFRFSKTLPSVVIADAENASKIEEAEKICNVSIAVKIICEGNREGWYSLEDIEKESTAAEPAATRSDDTLFMFFTSGTTGMPKIVCHTHFSHPVGHLTTTSWIGLTRHDIHYNISQPGWAKFAWSSFFSPWNVGATIFAYHTTGRFDAANTLELIARYKITTLCAPPTVLRLFIQEELQAYSFSFRECVAAGEPLNPEIIEEWRKGTGITIRDGYGQTESTCLVANLPNGKVKPGSMGKPTFLYDIVIADDEGRILETDEEGTICVKMEREASNGIFKGYLFDREKEDQVFKYGLYYTGDKAFKDEDGYIWFVGRDDDVIKSSDYRIGPFEVESVLLEHDKVVESAVVGSPHPVKGFEIKAFIVLHKECIPDELLAVEIFNYSRAHLAPYKIPRIIEFVDELPKTISGKIRRVELRALEAESKAKKLVNPKEFFYRK